MPEPADLMRTRLPPAAPDESSRPTPTSCPVMGVLLFLPALNLILLTAQLDKSTGHDACGLMAMVMIYTNAALGLFICRWYAHDDARARAMFVPK